MTQGPPTPLFSSEYFQNPYPTFSWLREHDPVHELRFPIGDVRTWMVTRYDDVRGVLGDNRFSSQGGTWGNDEFKAAGLVTGEGTLFEFTLPGLDPPRHTRIRRLAMSAFTPRRIQEWRETIDRIVAAALDRAAERGRFDLVSDYAGGVPAAVMGEILGFPLSRHAELVDAIERGFPTDPALMADVPVAFGNIARYASELVEEKRRRPSGELTSALIQASEQDEKLTEDELVALVAIMILASIDTTRMLISNAILGLFDHPPQAKLLRERPDLDDAAVEEFLRYEGAQTTALFRLTTEDVELNGVSISAGAPVICAIQSGNRDPEHFARPDELDLTRTGQARHLGFGHGLHNCMGAALARLVVRTAVPEFVRRFPDAALAVPREQVRYAENWFSRRVIDMPVDVR